MPANPTITKSTTKITLSAPFPAMETGIIIKQLFFIKKGLGKVYRQGIKEGRRVKKNESEKTRKIIFDSAKRKRALKIEFDMIKNIIY